jgi:ankyrin repeat protein
MAANGKALFIAAVRGDDVGMREQLALGCGEAVIEFKDICGRTPLIAASTTNVRERCVELLLDAGAQLEARDRDGWTALYCASRYNHPAVVSILLAAGARVDSATDNGTTPLMIAAINGHSDVARLLLDAGANREHRDNYGRTALDLATLCNKAEVVAIINEHERLETVVRPEVVACAGIAMPPELAELCGDYVAMTPERRTIQARQDKQ